MWIKSLKLQLAIDKAWYKFHFKLSSSGVGRELYSSKVSGCCPAENPTLAIIRTKCVKLNNWYSCLLKNLRKSMYISTNYNYVILIFREGKNPWREICSCSLTYSPSCVSDLWVIHFLFIFFAAWGNWTSVSKLAKQGLQLSCFLRPGSFSLLLFCLGYCPDIRPQWRAAVLAGAGQSVYSSVHSCSSRTGVRWSLEGLKRMLCLS